jgi:hypothetical protein
VIRNSTGEIKTFMETVSGYVPEPGETMEEVTVPFAEYARRLRLSVNGRSGETVRVPVGAGPVTVRVECPGEADVSLRVNGEWKVGALEGGAGSIELPCDVPGRFAIVPADRVTFCAAGEAVSVVEVILGSSGPD